MSRALFNNAAEFSAWANERAEETGDESLTGDQWFKDDQPKSYPAVGVFFWMERAGLIVNAWIEFVYPQDFSIGTRDGATRGAT